MSTSGKLSMLEYVAMTPATLRRQIVGEYERPLAEALQRFGGRCVRIVASGSSYNAALITRHYLRRWLEREVLVTEPFSFCAYELPPCGDEFPFVVSQSGYSSNALSALDALRRCGRMTIGVTANPQSDFKDRAELLVDYGAGEETVGYVTMGVTALCFFLCLFALRTAHLEGRLDGDGWQAERAKLYRTVEAFEQISQQAEPLLRRRYRELSSMESAFLIGTGPAYGVACEGALKLGETVQIDAIPCETEEFLHGPELRLTPAYTLFFLATGKAARERGIELWRAASLVTDRVFLLTDDPQAENADLRLPPDLDELLAPLCFLPFFQIAAFFLTKELHRWHRHPLVRQLEEVVSGKSGNYIPQEVL